MGRMLLSVNGRFCKHHCRSQNRDRDQGEWSGSGMMDDQLTVPSLLRSLKNRSWILAIRSFNAVASLISMHQPRLYAVLVHSSPLDLRFTLPEETKSCRKECTYPSFPSFPSFHAPRPDPQAHHHTLDIYDKATIAVSHLRSI